jgi:hypothetical protein
MYIICLQLLLREREGERERERERERNREREREERERESARTVERGSRAEPIFLWARRRKPRVLRAHKVSRVVRYTGTVYWLKMFPSMDDKKKQCMRAVSKHMNTFIHAYAIVHVETLTGRISPNSCSRVQSEENQKEHAIE